MAFFTEFLQHASTQWFFIMNTHTEFSQQTEDECWLGWMVRLVFPVCGGATRRARGPWPWVLEEVWFLKLSFQRGRE